MVLDSDSNRSKKYYKDYRMRSLYKPVAGEGDIIIKIYAVRNNLFAFQLRRTC